MESNLDWMKELVNTREYTGTLKLFGGSQDIAFIRPDIGSVDILVKEVENRKCALHEDLVKFEIFEINEWTILEDRVRDYVETRGEDYSLLLEGANAYGENIFQDPEEEKQPPPPPGENIFQDSCEEEEDQPPLPSLAENIFQDPCEEEEEQPPPLPPPSENIFQDPCEEEEKQSSPRKSQNTASRQKKHRRKNREISAVARVSSSNEEWGKVPVLYHEKWKVDELPSNLCTTYPFSPNIPVISFENNAPSVKKKKKKKKKVEILTPEALNRAIADQEQGIISLPKTIPVITTTPENKNLATTVKSADKTIVSNITLECLKREISSTLTCKEEVISQDNNKENSCSERETPSFQDEENKMHSNENKSIEEASSYYRSNGPFKLAERIEFKIESILRHRNYLYFISMTGRVIEIVKEIHSRKAVGLLKVLKNKTFFLFKPFDPRVPDIEIPAQQVLGSLLYKNTNGSILSVARIIGWETPILAYGEIIKCFGKDLSIQSLNKGYLISKDIEFAEFSSEVNDCLPPKSFNIPKEEYEKRRDYRSKCVFTIDPNTAKDLDDALSIDKIGEDLYKVAVHIADVSYFVAQNSALDRAALRRGTSVYILSEFIPMLPKSLCEDLCSLIPGVERLTYTVEWTMNRDGKITETWFGRSIIKSVAKLSYDEAEALIDKPDKSWSNSELPKIDPPGTPSIISQKLSMLNKIAKNLHHQRKENGSLSIGLPKVTLDLNCDTNRLQNVSTSNYGQSNRLVEELMLLANMSVAIEIARKFPDTAVLRRHLPPKPDAINSLQQTLMYHDIDMDTSSSLSLQKFLNRFSEGNNQSPEIYLGLNFLLRKPMHLAEYICQGMVSDHLTECRHYALSIPLYTHFTSPIRRYPDIEVHRLLTSGSLWDRDEVHKNMELCNKRRLAAKRAEEHSAEISFAIFVIENGPIENQGVVVKVQDRSFDVLLQDTCIVKRVFIKKQKDIAEVTYKRFQGVARLIIQWKEDEEKNSHTIVLSLMSKVNCTLMKYRNKPLSYVVELKRPIY